MTFRVGQKAWKDIRGYEGRYRVSNFGEVFSVLSDIVLKGSPSSNGYLTVALHSNGEQETQTIHRLVAEAFIDNPDSKPSVNHLDSCKTNNHWKNLEWCTPAENTIHGVAAGTIKGVPPKLTGDQANQIRSLYAEGFRMQFLAAQYAVSHSTIKNVIRGNYYAMEKAS